MEATVIMRGSRRLYGTNEITTHKVAATEELTVSRLIDSLPTHFSTVVDCAAYFSIQNTYLQVRPYEIQYVITAGGVKWNVPYDEVRVADFITTIGPGKPIYLVTGLQLGGGFAEIASLWPYINLVLELFSHTKDVAETLYRLYDWLHEGKDIPAPAIEPPNTEKYGELLSFIFDHRYLNPHELELIGLPVENGRKFIQACGYRYDAEKMLYVRGDEAEAIREILNHIDLTPAMHR